MKNKLYGYSVNDLLQTLLLHKKGEAKDLICLDISDNNLNGKLDPNLLKQFKNLEKLDFRFNPSISGTINLDDLPKELKTFHSYGTQIKIHIDWNKIQSSKITTFSVPEELIQSFYLKLPSDWSMRFGNSVVFQKDLPSKRYLYTNPSV